MKTTRVLDYSIYACLGLTFVGVVAYKIYSDSNSEKSKQAETVAQATVQFTSTPSPTPTQTPDVTLDLSLPFPGPGYYSSISNEPTAQDFCAGQKILGVEGSRVCLDAAVKHPATERQVLTSQEFFDPYGTLKTGTMKFHGEWNMERRFPGEGYYIGSSNLPVPRTICSGVRINGVLGTANCGAQPEAATPPTAVVKSVASAQEPLPLPDAKFICLGTKIGNLDGQAICNGGGRYDTSHASGIHRNKGGSPKQMTLAHEKAARSMSLLFQAGYREIPRIGKDDDGFNSTSVNKLTRTNDTWGGAGQGPRVVCGKSAQALADKIKDCETRNSRATPWDGQAHGNAAEGSWTLVAVFASKLSDGEKCDGSCKEVWRDDRTGLIWSDKLDNAGETKVNWCKAVGSAGGPGASPYKETDPSEYCDNSDFQDQKRPVSWCAEDPVFLNTPAGLEDDKGGMTADTNPQVRWRVPSLSDWSIANANGIRHVLPNMSGQSFWSSSVYSGKSRSFAWSFQGSYGATAELDRLDAFAVRCVGR